MSSRNPFSFRPWPVVFWTTLVYLALIIPAIFIQEIVPNSGLTDDKYPGVNRTEAWLDLATLTSAPHPYNSRQNDKIRDWILLRLEQISARNGVAGDRVTIFNDVESNVTMAKTDLKFGPSNATRIAATSFEGNNIMAYIRGRQDEPGNWWENKPPGRVIGKGLVLVNAHFDSVSTANGATDNGMGVVTALHAFSEFSMKDRQPEKGIIVMFNNAEEDGLLGAKAFGKHPVQPFVSTFTNLEGAGAGGRAMLLRSTDEEVTRAYEHCKHPFGNAIGGDFFKMGFVRSQTDYVVFDGAYGQRGLDLLFYKPRARYHTNQDDITHTTRRSLEHMLSSELCMLSYLSGDTGDTFLPDRVGSDGVWFDLMGSSLVLFNLRGMFAWSLASLVASPLILLLVTYLLHKTDRYYFFTNKVRTYQQPDFEPVKIGGFKGFIRFPFALLVAGGLTFGSAFLLAKVNPFVVYSSRYAVWAMMLSLFYFTFWFIMRGANFARPSALHRGYAHIWLFMLSWATLVAVTVSEDRFHMASGYMFVWFQFAVFLATLITFLELFALPKKHSWGQEVREDHEARDHLQAVPHDDDLIAPSPVEAEPEQSRQSEEAEADEPDTVSERTPLIGGRPRGSLRTTFANTYRRSVSQLVNGARSRSGNRHGPFQNEQAWSGSLPTWTWLLQFLILAPIMIIMTSGIGLTLVESVAQTGVDGSSPLLTYVIAAFFAILVLLPLTPFIHRVPHHIPVILLAVLVGTLLYNLTCFPFSGENRYKAFFQQKLNLDTGESTVILTGKEKYLRMIIADMPSAAGKPLNCSASPVRQGLVTCVWDGEAVAPRLADDWPEGIPPQKGFADLVTVNATRTGPGKGRIEITAVNSKNCILDFKQRVARFQVIGNTPWDDRFGKYPRGGVDVLELWARDFNRTWVVDTEWKTNGDGDDDTGAGRGLDFHVACRWDDASDPRTIPALHEFLGNAPSWAAVTKTSSGLVEGRKAVHI